MMENVATTHNLSPVWFRGSSVTAVRGEGIYLYDEADTRYIDFTSGIGVVGTGHCHPRVVDAIKKQAARLIFGQINVVYHDAALDLASELLKTVPRGLDQFFFSNSGAEAVEAAVKLAKHRTKRTNIIVFQGGYHGRTHLTMGMTTSKTVYRIGYQPLVPGIFVSPYPASFSYGWDDATTLAFALRELERLLATQSAPEETACIVVEPVLGEGGYIVPPRGFLRALREICDKHDILLVADEIQCGVGRTGRFFAVEHEDVVPDILVYAKGIGSGMPISGIAYPADMADSWVVGSHGGTYGGNPVACAAAAETIRVIRDENLVENARQRGRQLLSGLENLKARFPFIGDVRGLGLMAAVELMDEGKPDVTRTKEAVSGCQGRQLLLLTCGAGKNVIRWIPPLIVTEEQIDEGLAIFTEVLEGLT
jgi:4-aminobutyrate aminotransferase